MSEVYNSIIQIKDGITLHKQLSILIFAIVCYLFILSTKFLLLCYILTKGFSKPCFGIGFLFFHHLKRK